MAALTVNTPVLMNATDPADVEMAPFWLMVPPLIETPATVALKGPVMVVVPEAPVCTIVCADVGG